MFEKVKRFTIYPSSHYVTPRDSTLRAVESIKIELAERTKDFVSQGKLVEAQRIDHRTITSSSGTRSDRPVVLAPIVLGGRAINAEITLTSRDEMGFRMLIGREALAQGFTVDSTASYLGGRPKKAIRQKNRGRA